MLQGSWSMRNSGRTFMHIVVVFLLSTAKKPAPRSNVVQRWLSPPWQPNSCRRTRLAWLDPGTSTHLWVRLFTIMKKPDAAMVAGCGMTDGAEAAALAVLVLRPPAVSRSAA